MRYSERMEEKREPDVIEPPAPERPETDPAGEPDAVAEPVLRPAYPSVPPLETTLRNAIGRTIT